MSFPDDITKVKLLNALDLYDENKSYDNFARKAFNDDNVLIKRGVKIKDVLIAFDLINKKFYNDLILEIKNKNNYENIEKLKKIQKPYVIFTIKYYLNNYDYGCDKYNRLYIEELEETHIYNKDNGKYKYSSFLSSGK